MCRNAQRRSTRSWASRCASEHTCVPLSVFRHASICLLTPSNAWAWIQHISTAASTPRSPRTSKCHSLMPGLIPGRGQRKHKMNLEHLFVAERKNSIFISLFSLFKSKFDPVTTYCIISFRSRGDSSVAYNTQCSFPHMPLMPAPSHPSHPQFVLYR